MNYLRIALSIVISVLLLSCGGGGHDANTGGISFNLAWEAPTSAAKTGSGKAFFAPAPNVCDDYGIATISQRVQNASGGTVTSGSFACSAHSGTLNSVPFGTNYSLIIEGRLANNSIAWTGTKTGLAVTTGQTTAAGTVTMAYQGTDGIAPSILAANPASAATNIPVTSPITATFSEDMAVSSISETTFTLKQGTTPVTGTVTYNMTNRTATLTPAANLAYSTSYTATVTSGVKDMTNRSIASSYAWSFTTEATPGSAPSAPTGVSASPGNTQNTITWTAATGATSYNIYWSTTTGVSKTVKTGTLTAVVSSVQHTQLANGTTYFYVVTAVNLYGESVESAQATATPASSVVDLTTGLVAHYPFSGNANDESGNGNNGVVSGATLTADRFGNANSAYSFDFANNAFIDVSNPSLFRFANNYTVSVWVRMNNTGSGSFFCSSSGMAAGQYSGYSLDSYSQASGQWNGVDLWSANSSAVYKSVSNTGYHDDQWHLVVGTADSTQGLKIYVDGVLVGSSTDNSNVFYSGTAYVNIGGWGGQGNFKGLLDDMRIYNRALSATEIQALYQLPAPDSWQQISTTGAPAARAAHSAVWTGSEMIIWGGQGSTIVLNTGGRYNPTTDSWGTPPTTAGAPSARVYHSAIWTGTEMVVWGGAVDGSLSTLFNTGGRYNPATDSWGSTSPATIGAPAARAAHTAVWTGTEMIVWGGTNQNTSFNFNDGGRYNPTSNTWNVTAMSITGAPSGRASSPAVWTGSEMILWGGYYPPYNISDGWRYNPVSNAWSSTPISTVDAPTARGLHSAVWTGTEMIIWGGTPDGGWNAFNSGGKYNPATDTWITAAPTTTGASSARFYHSAVWTGAQMLIWGGGDGSSYLGDGGKYTP